MQEGFLFEYLLKNHLVQNVSITGYFVLMEDFVVLLVDYFLLVEYFVQEDFVLNHLDFNKRGTSYQLVALMVEDFVPVGLFFAGVFFVE